MRSEGRTLGSLLLDAFRWFDTALLEALHSSGYLDIRRPHSLVFAHLDRDGTTISELARRIGITRQSAHQTVRQLVAMGLVRLEADPGNATARRVVATEEGRRSVRTARLRYEELEKELSRRIGIAQVACMRRALEAAWGSPPGGK